MTIKVSTLLAHNTKVILDTSPTLGGPLNTSNFPIVNGGNPVTITGNKYPITPGTAGQVLTTNGAGITSWINIPTDPATAVLGGLANQILYQSAPSVTSFIAAPSLGSTFLEWSGSSFVWSPAGTGTVTSVGVTSSTLDITGTDPITTSGTFGINLPVVIASGSFTNANISIDIHGRVVAASNGTSGGGVTQIVAGTNITISPPTGLGTVVINSTSAGLTGGALNQIPVMTGATTNTYISAPSMSGTFLEWNGSSFIWTTVAGSGTVTSVGLTSPFGTITISGSSSPITTNGIYNVDLPLSGVTAAAYGSASSVATFTVNSRGIVTLAASTPISITPAQAGLKLYAENSSTPIAPIATGLNAIALGSGAISSHYGGITHSSGSFGAGGDSQSGTYIFRNTTISNAPRELFLDGLSAEYMLPVNSVVTFNILVSARRTSTVGGTAGFKIEGVVYQDAVGTAVFLEPPSITILGRTSIELTVSVVASATGALQIFVTGENLANYRWMAILTTAEINN